MHQTIGQGIGEKIDDLLRSPAAREHAPRLFNGLLANRVGLATEAPYRGARIVSAGFGQEARDFLVDDESCAIRGELALLAVFVDDALQVVDRIEVDILQLADLGLDIARHRKVDHEDRTMPPRPHGRRSHRLGDDRHGARGTADHDVRGLQFGLEIVEADRISVELRGQRLCASQAAVRNNHALDPLGREVPSGQRRHFTGTDQQRAALAQVREDAPRNADSGGGERDRVGTNAGLRAHALGGRECRLKQLIERGSGGARFLGDPIGVFELAEYLRLTEHHRVQSGSDAEGMSDCLTFLMHIEARRELEARAVVALEPLRQLQAARRPGPVQFGTVARRENDDLGHARLLAQGLQGAEQTILAEGHLFAKCDRRGLMIDAEDIECHSAVVFSNSLVARAGLMVGIIASSACAGANRLAAPNAAPEVFYTVTAELALARHEPRVAALQYTAASESNPSLWPRAVEVASEGLQPSLGLSAAERWIRADPTSLEAQRAAGSAALALHKIALAAAHYRIAVANSPGGAAAAFVQLEKELRGAENTYGARALADSLARLFPVSRELLRLQGFAALRADDPASAARDFAALLAQGESTESSGEAANATAEITQAWRRARVLAGDFDAPLAESLAQVERDATPANRFDYSLLL